MLSKPIYIISHFNIFSKIGSSLSLPAHGWVGANTTPLLNSAVHFVKQKTYNYFLLLQNMNSGDKNERVQKRISNFGGDGRIRTSEALLAPNALAVRCFQPLSHVSLIVSAKPRLKYIIS